MKRIFMIIIVACLCVLTFAACSNGSEERASGKSKNGKVKLTAIMLKHPLTVDLSKIEWLKEVEKRAGVEIKWEEVTADWDQKKGAILASGDIPDLIIGPNAITDADFAQFPGLFHDFSKDLDKLPNVKKMFEEKPETKIIATQPDGKIFGLPKYQRFWPKTSTRQFINKKWLDNLGLEMPTTWDELYEVLVAFKEKDANGNGDPNDEIPMDFAPVGTGGFGYFQPTVLLGSLGITPIDGGGQGYFVEDGKVKNFLVDKRYKKLVEFLNKCYKSGLINKEVFTQDYTKYQSLGRGSGDIGKVGYTFGWEAADRFGDTLAPQYTTMPVLKVSSDANYELSWSYDYNSLNYGTNMIQLSEKSDNKEAAMKFINELYDPKVSMQVLFGSLGTNIKDNGDGSYTVLPPQDKSMDPGTWKWTTTWADNGPMYISDNLKLTLGSDMQSIEKQTEALKDVLDSIDVKKDVLPNTFLKYSVEDNNTLNLNNSNFINLAMSNFSKWVTKGGIDSEWDKYVKQCEKMGLSQNIKIIQKYYDDYMSKQQ